MSEQITQEQQTAVPASNYTPVDSRAENIGKAQITRKPEQVRQDNTYQAQFPAEPEHPHDSRIQSLEAEVRRQKKDREFGQLKTVQERELYTLRERKAADEREQDFKDEQRKWVSSVAPELTRLTELRTEFTENEGWLDTHVAAVDKAAIQFRTLGSDLGVAKKMLADIESQYEAKLSQDELKLEAEIQGHKNRIQQLRDKRKKPEPQSDYLTAEDKLFIAAKAEWLAAEEAGNASEATRLRSVYWAERFARGQVND